MRLRFRPVSVALGGIFVLLIIGLYAIDRALSSSRRLEMSMHAVRIAATVQNIVNTRLAALNGVKAVYVQEWPEIDISRFDPVVDAVIDTTSGVEWVWITDSAGNVVQDHQVGRAFTQAPSITVLDAAREDRIQALMRRARETRKPQISQPLQFISPQNVVVLIDPIYVGGRFVGTAGLSITRSVFHQALTQVDTGSAGTAVSAGDELVYENAPVTGWFVEVVSMPIQVGESTAWAVAIRQRPLNLWLRIALWTIGLIALPTLIGGVLQERRAAMRVSERSIELERLSTELLRANRAKSEFLANVSHELRTPLNAIVGFVDLLRDGVYGELATRQVSPVERIAASATHLRHLVDQVLDIAKMAAGRLEVHTEPLALRPFVLDVVSEIESLVNERGLSLSIAVGASLPKVRTDPTHLRQILMNLLGNAVKYTITGGIAIRARLVEPNRDANYPGIPSSEKTWIALQVADSGIGIAAGDLERIFEEFEQVDSGSRGDSVTRGTGLGLPISRRLARLLGGEISVQSEIGHGSTFTLWLPVNPVDYRTGEQRLSVETTAIGAARTLDKS